MRGALHTSAYARGRARGPWDLRARAARTQGMWRIAALASVAGAVLALAAPAGLDEQPRGGPARIDGPERGAPATIEARPGDEARESRPDGVLVIAALSPERVLVADPLTGGTRERELPGGTLCHGPLVALGDRVVYAGSRGGRAVALSAPLAHLEHVRSLGPAQLIVPSTNAGRLWVGSWTDADHMAGRLSLREVDADGRVFARTSRRLPRWAAIDAHVRGGFLMTLGRGLVLRSPLLDRAQLRIRDGWVVGAAAERFAWCRGPCRRIHVWDGSSSRFDPPRGIRPLPGREAAFSPGGNRLALPVTVDGDARAAVIDLESATWTVTPATRLGDYAAVAWSPSGRWLYLGGRGDRVLASRGGTERAVPLPFRTGGTVMSITTTASTGGSVGR